MDGEHWHPHGPAWKRTDGVWLTRPASGGYVWTATRSLPDDHGLWAIEVEAPTPFVAMSEVDILWPIE